MHRQAALVDEARCKAEAVIDADALGQPVALTVPFNLFVSMFPLQ